jgi:hypothetical protein
MGQYQQLYGIEHWRQRAPGADARSTRCAMRVSVQRAGRLCLARRRRLDLRSPQRRAAGASQFSYEARSAVPAGRQKSIGAAEALFLINASQPLAKGQSC